MQSQRGELVPVGEVIADLGGPVQALRETPPQARHHFTRFDQVNQLVGASEADPDLGFMARLLALCSLPRSNPGNRKEYVRRNGPYTLVMTSGFNNKLPFGNLPRLLLAWVSTEAVRTKSRELVLGRSLIPRHQPSHPRITVNWQARAQSSLLAALQAPPYPSKGARPAETRSWGFLQADSKFSTDRYDPGKFSTLLRATPPRQFFAVTGYPYK